MKIRISFGAMTDSIGKQLFNQGFKYSLEMASKFQKQKEALLTLKLAGIIPYGQVVKYEKKIFYSISKHVIKMNPDITTASLNK